MITPVNYHLLIEPVEHESFISSERSSYDEIGIVVSTPKEWEPEAVRHVNKGDKVYFDSWLAAKFPKNDKEDYWLIKWSDVRAIENEQISEQSL